MRMRKRVLLGLLIVIPLALFVLTYNAASWRPELMAAGSPQDMLLDNTDEILSVRSRSGHWIAAMTRNGWATLVDVKHNRVRHDIAAGAPAFSDNERYFAVVWPVAMGEDCYPRSSCKVEGRKVEGRIEDLRSHRKTQLQSVFWPDKVKDLDLGVVDCAFSSDDSQFVAVTQNLILCWDVASGRLISKTLGEFGDTVQVCAGASEIWAPEHEQHGQTQPVFLDARTGKVKRVAHAVGYLLKDERFCWQNADVMGGAEQIYRISDGKKVFHLSAAPDEKNTMPGSIWSNDGKWMAVYRDRTAQLIGVGSWRVVARCPMPPSGQWAFDDDDHVLTLDKKGQVYRWRLR